MRTRRIALGLGLGLIVGATAIGTPIRAHAATGSLEVRKSLIPTTDTGLFNLQIDGVTAGTGANVGNGGTTGTQTVTSSPSPGTAHTVGETAGTSTSLNNYSSTISCTDGTLTQSATGSGPFTVNVTDGSSIVCTITNTRVNTGGGPRAQDFLGSGSDTTQFMMHALDGLYLFSPGCQQIPLPGGGSAWLDFSCLNPDPAGTVTSENYAHDQVHEANFLGSGNGIKQVCKAGQAGVAHVDYARSSRVVTASDCTGLHVVAYARDGISWEAFDDGTAGSGIHAMNNQATTCSGSTGLTQLCLTTAQLQGIFVNCTITNWNQVGGQNVPISIYTPQSGSGTRKTWDAFLGGDSSKCIPTSQVGTHVIDENSNSSIPASDRAGAIFPFSAGIWKTQVNYKDGAQLGAIDNVYPTNSNIANGSFPGGRFLYNVFCVSCTGGVQAPQGVVNYVGEEGWICKLASPIAGNPVGAHATNPATGNNYRTDISNTISQAGFVPVTYGVINGGDLNSDYCRLTTT